MKNLIILFLLGMGHFIQAQTTTTVTSPWPSDGPQPNREIYTYTMTAENQFVINWEMAIPSGSNFIGENSYSGGRIDYKHFLNGGNLAIGASLGWNSFSEYHTPQLYETADRSGAVYTDMVRHVYTLPIAVNVYYFFFKRNIKPYVGLGIGTQYSEQDSYFNIYVINEDNWGFLVKPEIGLQLEINEKFGFSTYATYNYATNNSNYFNIDYISSFNIGAGLYLEW
ncbi:outer membrane beta-barrel protein [Flavicella sp.]|uniref:outer membrane beta-barrel protein n=1 Tax=Flavicella sp. TaxID=2957742 RepID=UPI003017723E